MGRTSKVANPGLVDYRDKTYQVVMTRNLGKVIHSCHLVRMRELKDNRSKLKVLTICRCTRIRHMGTAKTREFVGSIPTTCIRWHIDVGRWIEFYPNRGNDNIPFHHRFDKRSMCAAAIKISKHPLCVGELKVDSGDIK